MQPFASDDITLHFLYCLMSDCASYDVIFPPLCSLIICVKSEAFAGVRCRSKRQRAAVGFFRLYVIGSAGEKASSVL